VILVLALALVLQVLWHHALAPPQARADALPSPPPAALLQLLGLGERVATAKVVSLWLQSFDNQPGISVPFAQLDYPTVIRWLDVALALDGRGQYPLRAAARLYSEVSDATRSRIMMDWLYGNFAADSQRRWPWLAHVAVLAEHRLHDHARALKYARALADTPLETDMPAWVRQLEWTVLEAGGERDAARILIGGLITSGSVSDPRELRFLEQVLQRLERRETRN
jgi:hypothetical protein